MSHVLSVYNFKGGVGKTTTSINLAQKWAKTHKVLLIDFDPQANLTSSLGIEDNDSVYDWLQCQMHNHQTVLKPHEVSETLHLIPGDDELVKLESNSQFITFGPSIVSRMITAIKHQYDIVIVDCPTNFGVLVRSVLGTTNSLLIPALADCFSLSSVRRLLAFIETLDTPKDMRILGMFFNKFNRRWLDHRRKYQEYQAVFKEMMLSTTVSQSIGVSEAHAFHESLYALHPDRTVSRQFDRLASEVMQKMPQRLGAECTAAYEHVTFA